MYQKLESASDSSSNVKLNSASSSSPSKDIHLKATGWSQGPTNLKDINDMKEEDSPSAKYGIKNESNL